MAVTFDHIEDLVAVVALGHTGHDVDDELRVCKRGLTVAGNTPAAIGRLVRKTRGR